MKHLAIFEGNAIDKILSGEKIIDGRASQIKLPPFGLVSKGDLVYMKRSGGDVEGQFLVNRAVFYDHPTDQEVNELKTKYARKLALGENFWYQHSKINYLTLMFIELAQRLMISPNFVKKDLRGWVVLG